MTAYLGDILVVALRPGYICYRPDKQCDPNAAVFAAHHCVFGSRSVQFQAYSARSAQFQVLAGGQEPDSAGCPSYTLPVRPCIGPKEVREKKLVLQI